MHRDADEDQQGRQDLAAWKRFRTGSRSDYDSVQRDHNGYPLFVKATHLSQGWEQFRDAEHPPEQVANVGRLDVGGAEDIFSGAVSSQDLSYNAIEEPYNSTDNSRKGKSVASFYSQLPRDAPVTDMNAESRPSEQPRILAKSRHDSGRGGVNWFIRKASAQLRHRQLETGARKDEEVRLPVVEGVLANRCDTCLALLPSPLTLDQWESHRLSIAHQLALAPSDVSARPLDSIRPSEKRQSQEGDVVSKSGNIILKSSNLGYTALERMGWRRGMGLGRAEWEYGLRSGRAGIPALRKERTEQGSKDIIVISDSEDSVDEAEIGSEDWLSHVRAEQDHLSVVNTTPPFAPIEPTDSHDETREEAPIHSRQRPLLEPIAIYKRPDRRGIGNQLPLSSRIVDDTKAKLDAARQRQGDAAARQAPEKMTKRKRKEREMEEREEWKALRSSLN